MSDGSKADTDHNLEWHIGFKYWISYQMQLGNLSDTGWGKISDFGYLLIGDKDGSQNWGSFAQL